MEEPRLEPRSMGGEAPFIEQVSKLKLIRNAKGDTQIEVSVVAGTTQAEMDEIAHDEDVARRWPRLAQALINLGQNLSLIQRDLDDYLSGDMEITDDAGFERRALDMLARSTRGL